MSPNLPQRTRAVRLSAVPEGLPEAHHFELVQTPLPAPGEGEVLVRNRYFSVFPGLRTLIGGEVDGVPLPPLRPGDTLFGPAVGEVLDGALPPGTLVSHYAGWREHAVLPAGSFALLDPALPDPAAQLSMGEAAYGALTRLAEVRPGDTVLVTGAAGGVGSLAGRIARLLGAGRVIGSTSSAAKGDRLTGELGYDAALLRDSGTPFGVQLAEAAPDGIDVLVDSVGGEQLAAAVLAGRAGARFALVGAVSGQFAPDRAGGSAPAVLDTFRIVVNGISLRGYRGSEHPGVAAEWTARFGGWLRSGEITFPHTVLPGIERAPGALRELIDGRHVGAVLVGL
ncbi:NADP-dependent oxidoreductase [Kitasatospora sp. NPDC002040]|uniref:NADP-dependent oxidoreductase n=1 Tax=Kitasatospora sp. NPDC002040 TaxID=3154661 RepID=UPI0033244D9F